MLDYGLSIQPERIQSDIEEFGAIGRLPSGGLTRPAFSALEEEAIALLIRKGEALGLVVKRDLIGNVSLTLEGQDSSAAPICFGSHLDTVPDGGAYDGALGVIAGLEVLRVFVEQGISPARSLELICFVAEESSRFGSATLGSSVFAGTKKLEKLLGLKDSEGITLGEALRGLGRELESTEPPLRDPKSIECFLELHIEQGRVLENEGIQVGIVETIANATRLSVCLEGQADHSGTTPMPLRRDALAAAAEILLAVESAAQERSDEGAVATVGVLDVYPGAMNVVPGAVELKIDIRAGKDTLKEDVVRAIKQSMEAIAKKRGIELAVQTIQDARPIRLSEELVNIVSEVATENKLSFRRMPCGAGHDCMNVQSIAPSILILVPSKDGRSHSPDEWTHIDDIVPGVELLFQSVKRLAQNGMA